MNSNTGYTVSRLPAARVLTNNALEVWRSHHTIHGLIEVDVTRARARLRELRGATGESLSMTAFVIHCLARALAREPRLNSVVRGSRRYTFDTVNVSTMVEREVAGEKVVSNTTIAAAETKSVREIHAQIRRAQAEPLESARHVRWMPFVQWLPGWLLRFVLTLVFARPSLVNRMGGVVGVTAVGMFASGIAWGLPITPNSVMLTIGGIGTRAALEDGQLVEREVLCLTVSFDHAVVDGAPAARFTALLQAFLSEAHGLDAPEAPAQATGSEGT